jgi:hypothetical protein
VRFLHTDQVILRFAGEQAPRNFFDNKKYLNLKPDKNALKTKALTNLLGRWMPLRGKKKNDSRAETCIGSPFIHNHKGYTHVYTVPHHLKFLNDITINNIYTII